MIEPQKPSTKRSGPSRAVAIGAAKGIVGLLVLFGLGWSIRSAYSSWQQQCRQIQTQMDALDQQLLSVDDAAEQRRLLDKRGELDRQMPRWNQIKFDLLAAAMVLYAIGLLPAAVALRLNCQRLGTQPRWSTALTAQLLGHIGKYVPGKAMVVLLRVMVLRRDQVKTIPATISVIAETLTMMASGATIAGVITLLMDVPTWVNALALLMAVAAVVPTLPPVMRIIVPRVSKAHLQDPDALANLDFAWLMKIWLASLVSWIFLGASFGLIIAAMPGASPLPAPTTLYCLATASFGLAIVAGFVSLLPGGAGVRELILATTLGVAIDPSRGFLAAIAARILSILVEAILALTSWIWLRISDHRAAKIAATGASTDERNHSPSAAPSRAPDAGESDARAPNA